MIRRLKLATKSLSKERALGMYKTMYLIRKCEESVYYLFLEGIMPGTIHQYIGQEACAVGMLYDLRKDDYMASNHRPTGHDIAKGVEPKILIAEMLGKETGCCNGKGGQMHIGDFSKGVITANAIVGGNLPIAAGIAMGFKMQKKDNVVICFFGDGATQEGSFHEALNFASVWKLPVVYVCENNLYGANSALKDVCPIPDCAAGRAASYAIPSEIVDGNDVIAVNEAAERAIKRARSGEGPTILELKTYRHGGHSRNDACGYRPKEELEEWKKKDPIITFKARILKNKTTTEQEIKEVESKVDAEIEEAVKFARESPFPKLESALKCVYWEDRK